MTTPAYQAPLNGAPTQLDAVNSYAHVNQLLGAHAGEAIYVGVGVDLPIHGGLDFQWYQAPENTDVSQPFTMSGTTVGRVVLPLNPVNNGSDVLVTLYPDNGSGSPLTTSPIASTHVPAAYQTQVAAPLGLPAGGPLALAGNNNMFVTGGLTSVPWAPPASTTNGFSFTTSYTVDGNYIISVGGNDPVTGLSVPTVFSTYYPGGAALNLPVPQPSLPIGISGCGILVSNGVLISIGGYTTANSNLVYTASWDSTTGTVGSWSAQTVLPEATEAMGVATYGSVIYCVGGLATVNQLATTKVYMNTVSNGQLGAWVALQPLPVALSNLACFVIGSWLVAVGGSNISFNGVSTTYFSAIQADGSIGPWQTGPALPASPGGFFPDVENTGQICLAGNTIFFFTDLTTVYALAVTADGPGQYWRISDLPQIAAVQGAFSNGDGTYDVPLINIANSTFVETTKLVSVPMISVPLFATGLTSGHTYHVVAQVVQNESASSYTEIGLINNSTLGQAYTGSALSSSRFSGPWTAINAGSCVPMQVYDASVTGNLLHIWSEPDPTFNVAQSTTSLFYNNRGLLTGEISIVAQPNPPLNANPTFTSGVSPWTAVNGTLTQSSAETQGGFAFSGLLTPSGSGGACYCETEEIPITQSNYGAANWVLVNGWFYSPTGYSNFDLQMNWFDSSTVYLATTYLGTTNLTANTWTQVFHYCQVPALSSFGSINPVLAGSPTAANLLYMSNVTVVQSPETVPVLTSAAQITYNTTNIQAATINQLV